MSSIESSLTACKAATKRILAEYDKHEGDGGWNAVGDALGVSGAMAHRVANEGYQPRDPIIRHKLGLPPLTDSLCAELLQVMLNGESDD